MAEALTLELLPLPLSGLPLGLEANGKNGQELRAYSRILVEDGSGKLRELRPSAVRTVAELFDVLPPEDRESVQPECIAYAMYRGVCLPEHAGLFEQNSIRYDITVLEPLMLGEQFNKTYGHYHAEAAPGLTYPEVYQVIHGSALYLLQKPVPGHPEVVEDFIAVQASAGDIVLVPPGYGHVTVNVGECPLVMANLVERHFSSEYGPFKALRGAAYYAGHATPAGGSTNGIRWISNPKYAMACGVNHVRSSELPKFLDWLGFAGDHVQPGAIYSAFTHVPESFCYLSTPWACGSWLGQSG